MIYAYDEPVVFPTIDLYDSGMMGMYLTAAKDQYDNALKELKEFLDKYGDFISPIDNDVDFWYNLGLQPIFDVQDAIWNRGGDPLRNPADRAELSRAMNRIPRATFAKLKQSATAAEKYLENKAKLESLGKWNPAYEKMILENMGLPDFEHWDTSKNGPWTRVSPAEFKDLNTYTSHIFDDLKDSFLGRTKDGRWLVNGVNELAMRDALTPHLGGIVGSDLGRWYYNQAKNELVAEGNNNPSDADIMKRLQDNIITANAERLHEDIKVDEYIKQKEDNDAAYRRLLISGHGNGGGGQFVFSQGPFLPWDTDVADGLMTASGTTPKTANDVTMGTGLLTRALAIAGDIRNGKAYTEDELSTLMGTSTASSFQVRSGLKTSAKMGNEWLNVTSGQHNRIYSPTDIMKLSIGGYESISMDGSSINTNLPSGGFGDNVIAVSPNAGHNSVITVPMRDGTIHQFQSVTLATGVNNNGDVTERGQGWYDFGPIATLEYRTEDGSVGYVTMRNISIDQKGNITARNKDNKFVPAEIRASMNAATRGEQARTNAVEYKGMATGNSSSPVTGYSGGTVNGGYQP